MVAASALEDFSRCEGKWYHASPSRSDVSVAAESPSPARAASALEDFSRSQGEWYHSFPPPCAKRLAAATAPRGLALRSAIAASPRRPASRGAACERGLALAGPTTPRIAATPSVASETGAVGKPGPASPTPTGRFREGDAVCVFSRGAGAWLRDGIVVQVLAEPEVVDGDLLMAAGSVKVLYNNGGFAKWVPPAAFGVELRRADFMVGDSVSVLCRSLGLWVMDGVVAEVLPESGGGDVGDGVGIELPAGVGSAGGGSAAEASAMPPGSVKVTYSSGSRSRWIPPAAFGIELGAQRQWDVLKVEEGWQPVEEEEEEEKEECRPQEKEVEDDSMAEDAEEEEECSTTASLSEATPVPETPVPETPVPETPEPAARCQRFGQPCRQRQDFRVSDPVCIFRRSAGEWSRDGVVVKVLAESAVVDGLPMPAGAVKAIYGEYAKWVPPAVFGIEIKHADFMVGDAVSVRCPSTGRWVADGSVVEVLSESAAVDGGLAMPAGSVKVAYSFGDEAKWIAPEAFREELRAQRQWSGEVAGDEASTADLDPEALETSGSSFAAQMAGSFMRRLTTGR